MRRARRHLVCVAARAPVGMALLCGPLGSAVVARRGGLRTAWAACALFAALGLLSACGGPGGKGANSAGGSGPTALPGDSPFPAATGSDCNEQVCSTAPTVTPPLPPNETEADCPWIDNATAGELEGNNVGKSTVLSTDPPGCRFYFAYDLSQMTMQISTQVFDDPIDAWNTMVTTSEAGANAAASAGIGDGAVLYQTSFAPGDGPNDWACAFTKGRLRVIVNTNQTTPSKDASDVATAIAATMPVL
jgi:hypothetical protein